MLRANMLEVFRIINKIEGIKEEDFFIRDLRGKEGTLFQIIQEKGFDWILLEI